MAVLAGTRTAGTSTRSPRSSQSLRTNPDSRRHIVSAWNVADVSEMALPPCHTMFQFYVADGRLSCQLYQRSADVFLGRAVQHRVLRAAHRRWWRRWSAWQPGEFVHTLGDAHLYSNHLEQARLQLTRTPRPLPTLQLTPASRRSTPSPPRTSRLVNYDPYPAIKAPIAV